MITDSTKLILVDSMCCRDNEKYLYSAKCKRRYVYNIISDAAVTSNKMNQQIKQDA